MTERLLDSRFEVESLLISADATDFEPTLPPNWGKSRSTPFGKDFSRRSPVFRFIRECWQSVKEHLFDFSEAVRDWHEETGIWIVLPDATNPDNLGLVFRSAAALGAAGVVLGERVVIPSRAERCEFRWERPASAGYPIT